MSCSDSLSHHHPFRSHFIHSHLFTNFMTCDNAHEKNDLTESVNQSQVAWMRWFWGWRVITVTVPRVQLPRAYLFSSLFMQATHYVTLDPPICVAGKRVCQKSHICVCFIDGGLLAKKLAQDFFPKNNGSKYYEILTSIAVWRWSIWPRCIPCIRVIL